MIDARALVIRPAERADVPALTTLTHELGYPSNTDEEVADRLGPWSERDDLLALVAVAGPQVVGVAALAVIPYFERAGSWGRVVALVVDAHTRGLGVGRRLLAATEHAALARGCVSMEISSGRHRTAAHTFYHSLGYVDRCERSAKFFKDLVPGAPENTG